MAAGAITEDPVRVGDDGFGRRHLVWWIAVAFVLFQLYTGIFGLFPGLVQRSVHVGFGLALIFVVDACRTRSALRRSISLIAAAIAVVACANVALKSEVLVLDVFGRLTTENVVMGTLLLIVLLEAARRRIGSIFVGVVAIVILYTLYGWVIPGQFGHRGYDLASVIDVTYLTTEGMWGMITGLSAAEIGMFIIFGAVLTAVGTGDLFINLALWIAGGLRGGAAQVATVASSLFGMINGSSAANAATTGALTIPMMKRLGYPPALAAAVEATASTGGQLMPPIMGVVAFLMAELTGVPYLTIALAAVIPGVLYYVNIMVGIYFLSSRAELKPIPASERPKARDFLTLRDVGGLVLPVGLILYLLIDGFSPLFSATWGTVLAILYFFIFGSATKTGPKERLMTILDGFSAAGKGLAYLAVLSPAANIIIALIGFSGIGVKFSQAVLVVGQDSLFLALILGGIVSLILGMGMPTAGAYLLAASVVAPSLMKLGVDPIASHFFIFYFSIIAAITPPVCATLFITSAMAGARWEESAGYAIRLAVAGFILPFVIVYAPDILLGQGSWLLGLMYAGTTVAGIVAIASAVFGFLLTGLPWWQRCIAFGAGAAMVKPGATTDLIGLALIALVVLAQVLMVRSERRRAQASPSQRQSREGASW